MNNQLEILRYLKTVESATLSDIYNNTSLSYFHNWSKYTSEIMSRLVAKGKVERVKRGVFKIRQRDSILNSIFFKEINREDVNGNSLFSQVEDSLDLLNNIREMK